MMVTGPLKVLGGSVLRRVQSMSDRFVFAVTEAATMPVLPCASTPTVPNTGLKTPESFAVWLTTQAAGLLQSRSTQIMMLLVSVPCDPHELVQGPVPSTPCTGLPACTRYMTRC